MFVVDKLLKGFCFFLNCVTTDEVNILQELSLQLLNSSNTSMTLDDSQCLVLQVGQYSTLAVPLRQFLTDGYAFIYISICYIFVNNALLLYVKVKAVG